ncbi:hypothetical protein Tco_0009264 [Tanacetum coccineum]
MSTYLKNMAGYKHNQLKTKSFEDIQMLFDKEIKRVNIFVDMDTELIKGKAEVDDDQEEVEIKKHMDIVPDDEVAIDVATKPPIIVDCKIIKEGKIGYFQIIRADGSVKRPEEAYERVLWGDLKVMFKPDVENQVWRNLQGHKVTVEAGQLHKGVVARSQSCIPQMNKEGIIAAGLTLYRAYSTNKLTFLLLDGALWSCVSPFSADSSVDAHANIVRNTQAMHGHPTNSTSSIPEDYRRAGPEHLLITQSIVAGQKLP